MPGLPTVSFHPRPRLIVGTVSDYRAVGETAKFQSPFAPSRRYRRGEDVSRLLGGRYSSFFAFMGSCADPAISSLLRPKPRSRCLCRLPSAPAASRTFSTLFCKSFLGCPVPCHGGSIEIAVGTIIADRPPRGPGRALLSASGSYLG